MKKVFLFLLTSLLSLSIQAKVGYLSGNDFAENATYQPEAQAKAWFQDTYPTGTVITWSDFVSTGIPADITTLWINIDRQGSNWAATGWDNQTLKDKVGTFVKNGGQLFVTSHAVLLANLCGRGTQGLALENWTADWSQGGDIWQANTNMCGRDNSTHPIFDGLGLTGDNKKFDLVGKDMRTDHNVMWGNIDEATQGCRRLATWGQESTCDHAGIVEFLPKGDYQGHIIACGLAAYQWGKTNSKIANVKKLTSNTLEYLESLASVDPIDPVDPTPDPSADMAYLLVTDLATLRTSSPAEYNAAKWFQDTYIGTDKKGKFISDLSNLSGIKVLWINIENTTTSTGDFSETDATALANFVKDGGHLLLTKKATYWAYKTGRINYAPNFYHADHPAQLMAVTNLGCGLGDGERYDRSSHEIFSGLTQDDGPKNLNLASATEKSYCGWQDYKLKNGQNASTDNQHKVRATNFETEWNADALAVEGGIGDYCYGNIILFNGDEDVWNGAILAIGASAYMWKEGNGHIDNVKALTSNALTLLRNTQPVKPAPDPCSNCFRITF